MFEHTAVMFLFAETPVHAGTGISLGIVDLPIQRERHTAYPIIQASGVKGAVRDWFERKGEPSVPCLFGPEKISRDEDAFAGAVAFSDARTTIFAVRSLRGVFAFATSKLALQRLFSDLCRASLCPPWDPRTLPIESHGHTALGCAGNSLAAQGTAILEEFAFKVTESADVAKIAEWLSAHAFPKHEAYSYWREKMKKDLLVLPENAFRDFLQMSTDVQAHICIDDAKRTVKEGALFYEECLPCDSILVASAFAMKPAKRPNPQDPSSSAEVMIKLATLDEQHIQMGGKATLGRGLMAVRLCSAQPA